VVRRRAGRLPVRHLFAFFAVVYRYLIWLRRPPTARLNRRGWEAFRRPGRRGRNAVALPGLVVSNLLEVLPQVGFHYDVPHADGSYQDHCPRCRRALVALAQSRAVGGFG
jgi:hypothetical protein